MPLTSSFVTSLASLQVATMLARLRGAPSVTPQGLAAMREAMLAELQCCPAPQAGELRVRLLRAGGADALWHLRPALMDLLAHTAGEPSARRALGRIDATVQRHWRAAPTSRLTWLG